MRKINSGRLDKQRIIIAKTNPLVNVQTRKVLLKHYHAKYRVKP